MSSVCSGETTPRCHLDMLDREIGSGDTTPRCVHTPTPKHKEIWSGTTTLPTEDSSQYMPQKICSGDAMPLNEFPPQQMPQQMYFLVPMPVPMYTSMDWQGVPQDFQYYNVQNDWCGAPSWTAPTGSGLPAQPHKQQQQQQQQQRQRRQDQGRRPCAQNRFGMPTKRPAWEETAARTCYEKEKHMDMTQDIDSHAADAGACGDPLRLAGNVAFSNSIINQLQGGQADERTAILKWLCPVALELALSTCGCRVMQTALEVAGGGDRAAFVGQFVGHAISMLESPNANHVLQKYIEVMPPATVQFVMDELASYPGGWEALACHKFGCRVEQRLMEHCSEEMTDPMTTAIATHADMLCRHPFGNYVVQHVLSYCSRTHRHQVAASLIQGGGVGLMWLAQNRMASNVLERALELCGPESQQALATAILSAPAALLEIGSSRFGVYVVRRMLEVLRGPLRDELLRQLAEGAPQLHASKFGWGLVELAKAEPARL